MPLAIVLLRNKLVVEQDLSREMDALAKLGVGLFVWLLS